MGRVIRGRIFGLMGKMEYGVVLRDFCLSLFGGLLQC